MKKVTVEMQPMFQLAVENAKTFINWMWKIKDKVKFDPAPLSYPRAAMITVKQDDEPIMMMPVHPVLIIEAMATKPDTDKRWLAMGLWKVHEQMEQAMKHTGMYETYFLCNDEDEVKAVTRRGWTILLYDPECKTWLLRRRIAPENRISVTKTEETDAA